MKNRQLATITNENPRIKNVDLCLYSSNSEKNVNTFCLKIGLK